MLERYAITLPQLYTLNMNTIRIRLTMLSAILLLISGCVGYSGPSRHYPVAMGNQYGGNPYGAPYAAPANYSYGGMQSNHDMDYNQGGNYGQYRQHGY